MGMDKLQVDKIHHKAIVNIVHTDETLETLKSGKNRQPLSLLVFHMVLGFVANAAKQEKGKIGEGRSKNIAFR